MEFVAPGGLGDQMNVTPIVRAWKKANPQENVRIFEPRIRAIWENNPWLNNGNQENGKRVTLNHDWRNREHATLADQYAAQLGIALEDNTPEVFLTEAEKALGSWIAERTVAIAPGANWTTRQWSRGRWLELGWYLSSRKISMVEIQITKPEKTIPGARGIFGEPLRKVMGILSRCKVMVGTDSGIFHLAAAVGIPQVILFGVVPGKCRAFKTTTIVEEGSGCDPLCDFQKCRRKVYCMDSIPVERVLEEVLKKLGG